MTYTAVTSKSSPAVSMQVCAGEIARTTYMRNNLPIFGRAPATLLPARINNRFAAPVGPQRDGTVTRHRQPDPRERDRPQAGQRRLGQYRAARAGRPDRDRPLPSLEIRALARVPTAPTGQAGRRVRAGFNSAETTDHNRRHWSRADALSAGWTVSTAGMCRYVPKGAKNIKTADFPGSAFLTENPNKYGVFEWRREAELNRCTRFCRPLPSRSAIAPCRPVPVDPGGGLLGFPRLIDAVANPLVVAFATIAFQAFA